MSRTISWARQNRRPTLPEVAVGLGEPKPSIGLDDLGIEMVCEEVAYDNGSYFVVDTVKDLMWVVCGADAEGHVYVIREVPLDKYEAIRLADEMREAWLRAEREGAWPQ